jgi:hypothetical protein
MRWPAAAVLAGLAAGTGVIAGLPAISAPVRVAALVVTSMATGGWVALQLAPTLVAVPVEPPEPSGGPLPRPGEDASPRPGEDASPLPGEDASPLPGRADFFISYTSADRAWAEWIAWQLQEADYLPILQAWYFRPGHNFIDLMHKGIEKAKRIILVLSDAYLVSGFATAEWQAVFAKDPIGQHGLLLPVRVEDVEPSGLLRGRIYIDLVGARDEATAVATLLEGIRPPGPPPTPPKFPGLGADPETPPPFPG